MTTGAVQTLELLDDFFPALFKGEKTNTLRWNEGDVVPGYLLFYASRNPGWKALVWVTGTRQCSLDAIASVYHMSAQELHTAMLKHYPAIRPDSEVLFIEYLPPLETKETYGIPASIKGSVAMSMADLPKNDGSSGQKSD